MAGYALNLQRVKLVVQAKDEDAAAHAEEEDVPTLREAS
jgi:hypothetical protein